MILLIIVVVALGGWVWALNNFVMSIRGTVYQLVLDLEEKDGIINHLLEGLPHGTIDVLSGRLTKSTEDAACYDVYANRTTVILPGESVVVPTGLRTIMYHCDALLFDRSGLAAKFRITRRAGVIDAKYPDEWGVVLVNEGREPFTVHNGDRIAQALFIPKFNVTVNARGDAVVETTDKVRTAGFGSTGK